MTLPPGAMCTFVRDTVEAMDLKGPSSRSLYVLGVVGVLAVVVPFFSARFFPSVDLWNHLAVHHAQVQAWSGAGPYAAQYALELSAYPYAAGYAALAVLHWLFPPLVAGAAALALSHVLLLVGAWALLRALRLEPWVFLLCLPACFTMPIWYGFVAYALAVGVALLGVAAVIRAWDLRSPTRMVIASAAMLLAVLSHVEAWAACGLLAGGMALAHPERARRMKLLLAMSAPSLLLAGGWLVRQASGGGMLRLVYGSLQDRLGFWHLRHLSPLAPLGMVAGAVVVGAMVAVWMRRRRGGPLTTDERTLLGLVAGATLVHVLFPKAVEGGQVAAWGQSLRTGAFSTVVAACCWTWLPARWSRWGAAVVAVLSVGMGVQAAQGARRFSDEVAPLEARLAQTPPGTVAVVMVKQGSETVNNGTLPLLAHVSGLWVLHGAVNHQFFTVPGTYLVARDPPSLPPTQDDLMAPVCRWAHRVDQVLQQGAWPELAARLESAGFRAEWREGRWVLWMKEASKAPPACTGRDG